MKRLLCILVVMVFLFSTAYAETEQLHTLWDMPLDISAKDFQVFIESKLLVKTEIDEQYASTTITFAEGSGITLFGCPTTMIATFDGSDIQTSTRIEFDLAYTNGLTDVSEEPKAALAALESAYNGLCSKYGTATFAGLVFPIVDSNCIYDVPTNVNNIDINALMPYFVPSATDVLVVFGWNNVVLAVERNHPSEIRLQILFSIVSTQIFDTMPFDSIKPTDMSDAF